MKCSILYILFNFNYIIIACSVFIHATSYMSKPWVVGVLVIFKRLITKTPTTHNFTTNYISIVCCIIIFIIYSYVVSSKLPFIGLIKVYFSLYIISYHIQLQLYNIARSFAYSILIATISFYLRAYNKELKTLLAKSVTCFHHWVKIMDCM